MSAIHREFLDLAAARLDGPLGADEERRLAEHLATCTPCRERAAAYESDRAALRALSQLPPPRDLWSRTAAALDREQARPARWSGRRSLLGRAARPSPPAAPGVLAAGAVLVVAVAVIAAGLVPGLTVPLGGPTVAQATPFAIQPSVIAYFSTNDGKVGVYMGQIDRACPENVTTSCQTVDPTVQKVASFGSDFVPERLAVSPDGLSGAVVGTTASGGAVYALEFPPIGRRPSGTPSVGSPTPSGPGASHEPSSPTPSGAPPTTSASGEPAAIIDHVVVVGEAPAYSDNGTMLAFSAMPEDGSQGPDIYLWRVGDESAAPLTDDHGSIFASWAGELIVGSRGGDPLDGSVVEGATSPRSFLLDPTSGEQRDLARAAWRPIVDPTGRFVIYWDGALAPSADGLTWRESQGGLYLAAWRLFDSEGEPSAAPTEEPAATESPAGAEPPSETPAGASPGDSGRPKGTPGASGDSAGGSPDAAVPTASPAPGEPIALLADRDYDRDPVLAWEVQWSPDGEWFGAWIGDVVSDHAPAASAERGRLTVGAIDQTSGRIDPSRIQLDAVAAVRGFDLGDHRVAWSTLPGADGSSEVRLLVWTSESRGLVRTTPGGGRDFLPAF